MKAPQLPEPLLTKLCDDLNSSAASLIKTPTISDDFLHDISEEIIQDENYMDTGWCSSILLGHMLTSKSQTPLIFLSMARRLSSVQTPPPVREIATSSSASGSPGKENRN